MSFIAENRKQILKIIVIILPMLGLGGLAFERDAKVRELQTRVVIEQEPIEVKIEQPVPLKEHDHRHTHPEFKQMQEQINQNSRWH